ncbi:ABC transporter permease [Sphingobacterium faecium]|uniref:ABC transporter permease n=1 Tax=Sphingobacterium faecium TaxID=34087 RepID=UPI0024693B74|nr:ABC transporter permease [Sphingobacterium faecium]MDH5827920.1 ABC transporter permease [Sphingobacterium faecium]
MLVNNLKIAWRNITKNKLYSSIKIGGFAFSIAICILIVLYIKHETSYNKFYPNVDRIYRIVSQIPDGDDVMRGLSLTAPAAKAIKDEVPAVEQSGRILPNPLFGAGGNQLTVGSKPENYYDDGFVYVDQSILEMFPSPIIYGQLDHALDNPNTIVLTKGKAAKYFKDNPVGQQIYLNNDKSKPYTITAVIDDIPSNSTLYGYTFFMSLAGEPFYLGEQNNWMATNYTVYVKLKENSDPEQTQSVIQKVYIEGHLIPETLKAGGKIRSYVHQLKMTLQNAVDIHLYSSGIRDDKVSTLNRGDIKMIWAFASIAAFILLIACINFINLSTANAATRAKEIGIRKTIGSDRKSLIDQFMVEAICYSLISLIIGLILAWVLLPLFNNLANKSLEIPIFSWYFIPTLLVALIFIGSIAGIYPALYLSGFKPISALKNKQQSNPKSSLLRNSLVTFQFATSIILIVSALVANQQINFILNKDLGYSKDQVIVLRGLKTLSQDLGSLKNELKSLPYISNVSVGDYLPVPIDGVKRNGNAFSLDDKKDVELPRGGQVWLVDDDYLSTFELRLSEGRNFNPKLASDSSATIVNKKLVEQLGITHPIGAKINNGQSLTIIGVVDDFIFESLKEESGPVSLVLGNSPSLLSIKVKAGHIDQSLAQITKVWDKFSPSQKINYSFLDEGFESLYQDVERTKNIFTCFAFIAIFIASLGLFGLATYITQQRTKEIGIRKVLGASSIGLLTLLSSNFIKLVFIAIVIAVPISWWTMDTWLQDFNYRIEINWLYFILAGFLAIFIAIVTISYQTLKVIRANPVNSLRDE